MKCPQLRQPPQAETSKLGGVDLKKYCCWPWGGRTGADGDEETNHNVFVLPSPVVVDTKRVVVASCATSGVLREGAYA